MGESALLVTLDTRINDEANNQIHALAKRVREKPPPGVIDVVPAYSSLLVRFDPTATDGAALHQQLVSTQGESSVEREARTHIMPVAYGGEYGPDLAELAASNGLDSRTVIRLHTRRTYRVYFLGFMPGFGYLGSVSRSIAAPRLPSPRIRVPVGSVGIAGRQTGVYPLSSPGGWRIIGRTPASLWDPFRDPPATLAPGDSVRFVESDWQEPEFSTPVLPGLPARPVFQVVSPGALTTVQDLGRPGYGSAGLPQGGAMDPYAAARANALVGNRPAAAVLEITLSGPTLLALKTTTIAVTGAEVACYVDSFRVPEGCSWLVRGGSTMRFELPPRGPRNARAYLALAGGFDVPLVMGSRSTYLPATFGGYIGRPLAGGDLLGAGSPRDEPAALAGRQWTGAAPGRVSPVALRIIRYDGPQRAARRAFSRLCSVEWAVDERTDRMGTRLRASGDNSSRGRSREQTSFGVVRGAVQLPPGGDPIILNADHQTTGGYPLLGVVAEADWPILAQLLPGEIVRFEEISVAEATHELLRLREQLRVSIERLARGAG